MVVGLVVVGRLHRDFRAFLCRGQGEGAARCSVYRLTVGEPLVFDFARVEVVGVCDFGGQSFAYLCLAANFDFAFVIARLWIGVRIRRAAIGNGIRRCAQRVFCVFGIVFVGRAYGDFRAFLCGGEGEGAARCPVYRLTIGEPLVFDFAGVEVVGIADFGGQRLAYLRLAADFDFAFVVARLRLRVL